MLAWHSSRASCASVLLLIAIWACGGTAHGDPPVTTIIVPAGGTQATIAPSPTKTVTVGFKGYSFFPNNTVANTGDTIEFNFWPSNHSVVRSEYMWPCEPYETTGTGKAGFWSGFFVVQDNETTPRWRLTITDINPIFFYSSGQDDCNKYGMVGGINVKDHELQMQFNMALDASRVTQPKGASDPSSSTSSTPNISTAALVGAAIGVILAIALIIALIIWYRRTRRHRRHITTSDSTSSMHQTYPSDHHRNPSSIRPSTNNPPPPLSSAPTSPLVCDGDTIYVPVKRSAIISSENTNSYPSYSSPRGGNWSDAGDDGESGVLRAGMLPLSPGPTTPASTVASLYRADSRPRGRVLGHGTGTGTGTVTSGTGMLEGTGASLFPYNNDSIMGERGRGAGGVAVGNSRPSELA